MRSGNPISVRLDLNRNLVLVRISIVVFLLLSLSINPMLFVRWPGLDWSGGQTERNAPFEIFPLTPFSTCGLGMSRSRLASSLCGFGRVSPFNGGSRPQEVNLLPILQRNVNPQPFPKRA